MLNFECTFRIVCAAAAAADSDDILFGVIRSRFPLRIFCCIFHHSVTHTHTDIYNRYIHISYFACLIHIIILISIYNSLSHFLFSFSEKHTRPKIMNEGEHLVRKWIENEMGKIEIILLLRGKINFKVEKMTCDFSAKVIVIEKR